MIFKHPTPNTLAYGLKPAPQFSSAMQTLDYDTQPATAEYVSDAAMWQFRAQQQ